MRIEHKVPLKTMTTFKIGGPAREFIELTDPAELPEALAYAKTNEHEVFILGGGSNLLVSDRGFDGLVIRVGNRGLSIIDDASTNANQTSRKLLKIGSGEIWDDVVAFSVDHGLWGIENLSRIPGRSGAFVVQNVGAYGAEAKEVVVSVEVYDRKTKQILQLSNEECRFGYRQSIFNTTEKNRYIILSTTIELSTIPNRRLNYPDLQAYFEGNPEPSQLEIRIAVKSIRDKKFPFPAESIEGNAGSFFKNVLLTPLEYTWLEERFSAMKPEHLERLRSIRNRFPVEDGVKIPVAFLLDVSGLKGFSLGPVSLNPTQPVIVLNTLGEATATDVLRLVNEVRTTVQRTTGLHIHTEPELIGFTEKDLRSFGFDDSEIGRYIYDRVE